MRHHEPKSDADPAGVPTSPVLSVVVPCFNEAATVERSIRSLLERPFVLEVIVVDDRSTDGTWDVVKAIRDPRVHTIRHERNQGKGAALPPVFGCYRAIRDDP